jgi:aminoglycoside 3-N-acetyltransferase
MQTCACVVNIGDKRQRIAYPDVVLDDEEFEYIGDAQEAELAINVGRVGSATCRPIRLSDAVDFSVKWMAKYRM